MNSNEQGDGRSGGGYHNGDGWGHVDCFRHGDGGSPNDDHASGTAQRESGSPQQLRGDGP